MASRPRIWSTTLLKRVGTRTSFPEENSLFQRKYSVSSMQVTLSKTGKRLAETSYWRSETTQWKCHCVSHLHLHLCVLMSHPVCGIEHNFTKSLKIAYILHSVGCAWRRCIISVFMFNIIIFHSAQLQVVSTLYNLLNPVNKSLLTKHTEDTHHSMEFLWVKTHWNSPLVALHDLRFFIS